MSELFAKLTNLSYEFFGVIMPGAIAHVLLILLWAAMGATAPVLTYDGLSRFSFHDLVDVIDSLTTEKGIGVLILLAVFWYFLGHITLWISRSREKAPGSEPSTIGRTLLTLTFRTPRPSKSYEPKLEPIFEAVKSKFEVKGVTSEWRHFYPIAKNYLAQRVSYSLVATYQHKYTLHRSIACLAALWFWALMAIAIFGVIAMYLKGPQPDWYIVLPSMVSALVLAWGFSGSYRDNWQMFGNTIITECYALLNGPQINVGPDKSRSH